MNIGAFLTEAVVICALFHMVIYLIIRFKPDWAVYGYPTAITQRWVELGKAAVKEAPPLAQRLKKKGPVMVVLVGILSFIVYRVNGCRSFLSGFLVGYGLWLIVDWYDALVLDCLWFCHSKTCVLPGTEDMGEAYHDFGYHIKASLTGMVIGLPICLLVGLAVQIFAWF